MSAIGIDFPVIVHQNGDEQPPEGTPIWYMLGKNGIFLCREGVGLMHSCTSHHIIPVDKLPQLKDVKTWAEMDVDRLPLELLLQVLNFFRAVYKKQNSEAVVILYFNPTERMWRVEAPDQRGVGLSVDYGEVEPMEGYLPAGTIHSHCNIDAFHSGTDTHDEAEFDGLHITLGHITSDKPSLAMCVVANRERFPKTPVDYLDGVEPKEVRKRVAKPAATSYSGRGYQSSWTGGTGATGTTTGQSTRRSNGAASRSGLMDKLHSALGWFVTQGSKAAAVISGSAAEDVVDEPTVNEGVELIEQCGDCGTQITTEDTTCPECGSNNLEIVEPSESSSTDAEAEADEVIDDTESDEDEVAADDEVEADEESDADAEEDVDDEDDESVYECQDCGTSATAEYTVCAECGGEIVEIVENDNDIEDADVEEDEEVEADEESVNEPVSLDDEVAADEDIDDTESDEDEVAADDEVEDADVDVDEDADDADEESDADDKDDESDADADADEDETAVEFKFGDKVRIKSEVSLPVHGWQTLTGNAHNAVGSIRAISQDGIYIAFSEQNTRTFKALPIEVELAEVETEDVDDTEVEEVDTAVEFMVGDKVVLKAEVGTPVYGWQDLGSSRRTWQAKVKAMVEQDGVKWLVLEYGYNKSAFAFKAAPEDIVSINKPNGKFKVGDKVRLTLKVTVPSYGWQTLGSANRDKVGTVKFVSSSGVFVEFYTATANFRARPYELEIVTGAAAKVKTTKWAAGTYRYNTRKGVQFTLPGDTKVADCEFPPEWMAKVIPRPAVNAGKGKGRNTTVVKIGGKAVPKGNAVAAVGTMTANDQQEYDYYLQGNNLGMGQAHGSSTWCYTCESYKTQCTCLSVKTPPGVVGGIDEIIERHAEDGFEADATNATEAALVEDDTDADDAVVVDELEEAWEDSQAADADPADADPALVEVDETAELGETDVQILEDADDNGDAEASDDNVGDDSVDLTTVDDTQTKTPESRRKTRRDGAAERTL